MGYLMADAAIAEFIDLGLCTPESAPNPTVVQRAINAIEIKIDAYLGRSLAPKDYISDLTFNTRGLVVLPHIPVINVSSISLLVPRSHPIVIETEELGAWWLGGATIAAPRYSPRLMSVTSLYPNFIFPYSRAIARVAYRAGYEPIDPLLTQTVLDIVLDLYQNALDTGGSILDLGFLREREIQSISSPGGASEAYHFPSGSSGGRAGTGLALDIYLAPLDRFRQKHFV